MLVEAVTERLRELAPDTATVDSLPEVDEGIVFKLPQELR